MLLGTKDVMPLLVLIRCITYLRREGKSSYSDHVGWCESDTIFWARFTVYLSVRKEILFMVSPVVLLLTLTTLSNLFLFSKDSAPPQLWIQKVQTLSTNLLLNNLSIVLFILKVCNFLKKYSLCWAFANLTPVLEFHVSLLSVIVPRYLYSGTISVVVFSTVTGEREEFFLKSMIISLVFLVFKISALTLHQL